MALPQNANRGLHEIDLAPSRSECLNMSTEAKLHRQNERLDLLLNLTSRITSNLDLRELLRATSANIRDVVPADAAGVAFFDEGSNKSRIYAVDFPDAKGFVKEELVVTPGRALKRAWESSKAVIVNTNDREELGPEIYDLVVAWSELG